MNDIDERGTGRTTRMLEQATMALRQFPRVYVMCKNQSQAQYIANMFADRQQTSLKRNGATMFDDPDHAMMIKFISAYSGNPDRMRGCKGAVFFDHAWDEELKMENRREWEIILSYVDCRKDM